MMAQAFGLPYNPEIYDDSSLSVEETSALKAFLKSDDADAALQEVIEYAVALRQRNDANAALALIRHETGEAHAELPAPPLPELLIALIPQVQFDGS